MLSVNTFIRVSAAALFVVLLSLVLFDGWKPVTMSVSLIGLAVGVFAQMYFRKNKHN